MIFNSLEFFLFLPIVFILYWFVFNKSLKLQNLFVLLSSYFFYGWWSWKFLCLLVLSTLLDYLYGLGVSSSNKKKAKYFLLLSIVNNLGVLGIFKYYNFFALQFTKGFEALGLHSDPLLLNIVLPIGISFYTFHGMSYVFDIYRAQQKPVSNIVDYAVFVSFFPLLVAGPIERANHLLPQIQIPRYYNYNQAVEGCRLILWGLFKKVFIADNIASIVDKIFLDYQHYNGASLILAIVGFSFQIYCDFSGYSDIAIGTAKLLGFELLSNFKFPYFSRNIAEFWKRWHISLSSWFRDYVYIPLGGSKNGKFKSVINIFIIFLLSAFWHGAELHFILWGFIHAVGFIPLFFLTKNMKYVDGIVAKNRFLPTISDFFKMFSTFIFVSFAWIFFRLDTNLSFNVINHIFYSVLNNPETQFKFLFGEPILIYITVIIMCDWWLRHDERKLRIPSNYIIRYFIYILLTLISMMSFMTNEQNSFIYFQF